ncbi:MAG: SAM-dependent chlorinase/fluorinase [Bacteroidetes bacterium]|nr:SAM-dependent chlorinase/fluorinase [Bacteroidota bacterium]
MALLTLTSDFGEQDYLSGAVKGRILRVNTAFQIVDVCHSVEPFHAQHAAYVCRNALPHFPPGSFHMILINLFDVRQSHVLVARQGDDYYAFADNGLAGLIFDEGPAELVSIALEKRFQSDVLHRVDVMVNSFHQILEGAPLSAIGQMGIPPRERGKPTSRVDPSWMEGHVIYIDRFENVVVDITRDAFEVHRQGRPFQISFLRNEVIDRISESYADVPEGEKLALFNAAGYLEIAINKGQAAGLFGLQPVKAGSLEGSVRPLQSSIFYHLVRIRFG